MAESLAGRIKDSRVEFDLVIGILRGGGPLALVVADRLGLKVDFINVKSYTGVNERKQPRVLSTITEDINGKRVILVDDLVDEGTTMRFVVTYLASNYSPSLISTSSLFIKPWSSFKPDYYLDVVKEWIVFPWELCEFNILRC